MNDPDTPTTGIDEKLQTHVQRAFDFNRPPETFEVFWEKMMRTFERHSGVPCRMMTSARPTIRHIGRE